MGERGGREKERERERERERENVCVRACVRVCVWGGGGVCERARATCMVSAHQ